MRLALHCGYAHPELLWSVLDARQIAEIEVYAGIEPIAWDVPVSEPLKEADRPQTVAEGRARFDSIAAMFGAAKQRVKEKKHGKRSR